MDWYGLLAESRGSCSTFTIKNGKIAGIDMIADPDHLGQLEVAFLDE